MKVKEFPLMHRFLHGAFSANSGGDSESTGEMDCHSLAEGDGYEVTKTAWSDAETWLRMFVAPICNSDQEARRHAFWLGMEADSGQTIMQHADGEIGPPAFKDTDGLVKAPPYKLLDLYY